MKSRFFYMTKVILIIIVIILSFSSCSDTHTDISAHRNNIADYLSSNGYEYSVINNDVVVYLSESSSVTIKFEPLTRKKYGFKICYENFYDLETEFASQINYQLLTDMANTVSDKNFDAEQLEKIITEKPDFYDNKDKDFKSSSDFSLKDKRYYYDFWQDYALYYTVKRTSTTHTSDISDYSENVVLTGGVK